MNNFVKHVLESDGIIKPLMIPYMDPKQHE